MARLSYEGTPGGFVEWLRGGDCVQVGEGRQTRGLEGDLLEVQGAAGKDRLVHERGV